MRLRLTAIIAALLALARSASALVTPTTTPVYVQVPRSQPAVIGNGNGSTAVLLFTPGVNGSKVVSIVCTNTDTNPYTLQLIKLRNGVSYLLGSFTIAASSGNVAATTPTSILSQTAIPGIPIDSDGNPYIMLEGANAGVTSTDALNIALTGTITNTKVISCVATGGDF